MIKKERIVKRKKKRKAKRKINKNSIFSIFMNAKGSMIITNISRLLKTTKDL